MRRNIHLCLSHIVDSCGFSCIWTTFNLEVWPSFFRHLEVSKFWALQTSEQAQSSLFETSLPQIRKDEVEKSPYSPDEGYDPLQADLCASVL